MMEKLKKKLKSQSGESLAETLVSLLIAALALIMLAGAMSASSGVITRSKEKLDDYYSANEGDSGVIKMKSGGGTSADLGITITDSEAVYKIANQSFKITYYENDEFSKTPVIAYKYTPD